MGMRRDQERYKGTAAQADGKRPVAACAPTQLQDPVIHRQRVHAVRILQPGL